MSAAKFDILVVEVSCSVANPSRVPSSLDPVLVGGLSFWTLPSIWLADPIEQMLWPSAGEATVNHRIVEFFGSREGNDPTESPGMKG